MEGHRRHQSTFHVKHDLKTTLVGQAATLYGGHTQQRFEVRFPPETQASADNHRLPVSESKSAGRLQLPVGFSPAFRVLRPSAIPGLRLSATPGARQSETTSRDASTWNGTRSSHAPFPTVVNQASQGSVSCTLTSGMRQGRGGQSNAAGWRNTELTRFT